eukprot:Gregarina_sp_Pseudo_9__1231@NODE_1813_length_1311_cov_5_820755_g1681_i0_p1_GENE_NODE_1813_length_1311_cov_5_820755_g1681_i0NODE_1813_length_1311_cov_5_820755_g1681_i0_p1_ORF_typecomplete_len408_score55_43_NODE_1813_length_1311_cov_5_820755_g1681_i0291252
MPRNLPAGLSWMESPLRPSRTRTRQRRDQFHVDDHILPTAYSKVGEELLSAKYSLEVESMSRCSRHSSACLRDEFRTFGAARPSLQSSLIESIPRHCHSREGGPCSACCRRACDDCREAWNHTHTHIDPWEIEVVSTSTAQYSSEEAASGAASAHRQLEPLNEAVLFSAAEDGSSLAGDAPSAVPCPQPMPTPLMRVMPVVGASAPSVNVLIHQVFGPLIEFCSGGSKGATPAVVPATIVGSSDPLECLTTTSPASSSTTQTGVARGRTRKKDARLPASTHDRSRSVPRIRDATPPPARQAKGPRFCGEERRPAFSSDEGVLSRERIPSEMKLLPTSYDVSSNFSTERLSEFDLVTEALCAGNARFLRHTSRVAWPMRDQRGRRAEKVRWRRRTMELADQSSQNQNT